MSDTSKGVWVRSVENGEELFRCSSCDMIWFLAIGDPIENEMYYCPRCGSKMDTTVFEVVDT